MKKSASIKYAIAKLKELEMIEKVALDKAALKEIIEGLNGAFKDEKRLECFGGMDNLLMQLNGETQQNLFAQKDPNCKISFIHSQEDFI